MAAKADRTITLIGEIDYLIDEAETLELTTVVYLLRMARQELWNKTEEQEGDISIYDRRCN